MVELPEPRRAEKAFLVPGLAGAIAMAPRAAGAITIPTRNCPARMAHNCASIAGMDSIPAAAIMDIMGQLRVKAAMLLARSKTCA